MFLINLKTICIKLFIRIIEKEKDVVESDITYFIKENRTYPKISTEYEINLMKFLLSSKAKFNSLI